MGFFGCFFLKNVFLSPYVTHTFKSHTTVDTPTRTDFFFWGLNIIIAEVVTFGGVGYVLFFLSPLVSRNVKTGVSVTFFP